MQISLKDKIIGIITLISGLSLLISVTYFSYQNIKNMKNYLIREAKTTAVLTSDKCLKDLTGKDPKISYTINQLKIQENIIAAGLYNAEGKLISFFTSSKISELPDTISAEQKIFFGGEYLNTFHPIYSNNTFYGTLYIQFSTEGLNIQIRNYFFSVIVIFGILFLLVIVLALLFQKMISRPILNLAKTTREITENQDYSVRVKNRSGDEIGILYDSFNDMLDQVHYRQKQIFNTISDLQESEERYRKVVELSPNGIILHRDKKVIYVNPKAVKLSGYNSSEEIIGKSIFDFIHPEFKDIAEERLSTLINKKIEVPVIEQNLLSKDGSTIRARIISIPFLFKKKMTILSIIEDITNIKETEQALKNRENQFKSIFEKSNDAMYVIQNQRFVLVNPRFVDLFEYSHEEILSPAFDLMRLISDENKEFIEKRRNLFQDKKFEPANYSFRGITKAGRNIEVEVNLSKIDWFGNEAILGIVHDVTQHRILEEQLRQSQKMEAIGTLAGGVAHDFNNLLTVISGHVELALLKSSDTDPLLRHIQEIEKAGKRAQNLTRQLLAFSRKQIIKLETISVNKIITEMGRMLARLIGEDIDFQILLSDKTAPIMADPGQIEQVVMNLVVNARDAISAVNNPGKSRKITIETSNIYLENGTIEFLQDSVDDGLYVVLSVSDTGIGMDEEIIEKIFDPFFTTKGVGKGTGLGLSTIYGIVKQNKGQVSVYSEIDKGTTIKIYWPCDKSEIELIEETEQDSEVYLGSEGILFVEDDDAVRSFAVSALQDLGYTIYHAEDAHKAIGLVQKEKIDFDLLITDLVMPEISGNELAEFLRHSIPDLKVIYTSGYTAGHIADTDIIGDNIQFIQKPYSVKDLSQKIREVLEKQSEKVKLKGIQSSI